MDLTKENPQMNKHKARRYLYSFNSLTSNILHQHNPWVVVWWSMAFPGMGHLLINSYVIGFALILWELAINNFSNLNLAIFYSMIGDFSQAKDVLNSRWLLFYVGTYIFAAWDCYQRTVKINQLFTLAYHQTHHELVSFYLSPIELNFLEKRTPWISAFWSVITPGVGQIYNRSILVAFITMILWIVVGYSANILEGITYTIKGEFETVKTIMDPQWFLFFPSGYLFIIYHSYVHSVAQNKIYKIEQSRFLKSNYQKYNSKYPV